MVNTLRHARLAKLTYMPLRLKLLQYLSSYLGESAGAKYIYLCITGTNYGTGNLSVTGNVIVGDQSSDVGLAFHGHRTS